MVMDILPSAESNTNGVNCVFPLTCGSFSRYALNFFEDLQQFKKNSQINCEPRNIKKKNKKKLGMARMHDIYVDTNLFYYLLPKICTHLL